MGCQEKSLHVIRAVICNNLIFFKSGRRKRVQKESCAGMAALNLRLQGGEALSR